MNYRAPRCRITRCCLVALLLPALTGYRASASELEVGDKDYQALAGFDRSMYFYLPGVTPSDTVFEIVDQPSHGTVRQDPDPMRWQYKLYRSEPDFSGTDSFTYRAVNSQGTSNVATVVITVSPNHAPESTRTWVSHFSDLAAEDQWHYLHLHDPDRAAHYGVQDFAVEIVDAPAHGTVAVVEQYGAFYFTYNPDAGFTGRDAFTYRMSDGALWSPVVPGEVLVRERGDLSELDIDIIVDDGLGAPTSAELARLQADMEAMGYGVSLIDGSGMSALDIWQRLRADRLDSSRWLFGAILIGDLPKPGGYDKNYWHLANYRTDKERRINADIWVSRIPGDDADLIRNALDANHHYRNGTARLPRTFWDCCDHEEWGEEVDETLVARVWPEMLRNAADDGDVYEPFTLGADTVYRTDHNQPGTPNGPYQTRFAFIDGCNAIKKNNGPQTYQWSRGGANVMSIGANDLTGPGAYNLVERLEADEPFADILAGGEPMGSFLLATYHCNWQMNWAMTHVFGDPSLPVLMYPGNACPTITGLSLSQSNPVAGQSITATVSVEDADASASDSPAFAGELQVEWFTDGYERYSRMPADVTHVLDAVGSDSLEITYDQPHCYELRAEAMDEWRARAWKQRTVVVANDPGRPLRINCGASRSVGDWHDGSGRVWLHDQQHTGGTWGWSGKSAGDAHDGEAVAATELDPVFQRWRKLRDNKSTVYRIPLPDGTYTVELGFADMRSSAAGERLLDARIEDQLLLDDFDVYATAGSQTACVRSFQVAVADGELTIDLRTADASSEQAGIAMIRVLPPDGTRTVVLHDIGDSMPFCSDRPDLTPTLSAGAWSFPGLSAGSSHRFGWEDLSGDQ